ncbi:MAG: glycosyltransferase [Bacteroidia bacterium]|jgi:sugar transferase (PEP-CTERM/EpsH1 system associated)
MKLFVLLSRIPYPLEKGDKLRAFHQIKRLSLTHEIVLCCLNDATVEQSSIDELNKYCSSIHIINLPKYGIIYQVLKAVFSTKPIQVGYFYSRYAQLKINALLYKHNPDKVFCQLIRTSEYLKYYTKANKTLDYMDVLSKGMERRIEKENILLRPIFKLEYLRLKRYERKIFDYFEQKVIISQQDKDLINHPFKERINIVANGVDTHYFKKIDTPKTTDLLFTGNMSYPPNVDSAVFLVEKIMPLLVTKYPNITLTIAGHNPAPAVKRLASANVTITGWVEDLRLCYASSRIFIAPMNIGTGLQNKLLEAMSMHIPCITSSLANNALMATHNESILIGNSPEEYAQHIFSLLENPELANRIATTGNAFVIKGFDWDNNCKQLERIICT